MSIPANPKSMHGWFGYRHIPYSRGSLAYVLAREIVEAGLPKKEFFETIALAEAARSYLEPGLPIYECCSGHGLLGLLLALDARVRDVVILDRKLPPNCTRMFALLSRHFPELCEKTHFEQTRIEAYRHFSNGNFIAAHACGEATEAVLSAALRTRGRLVVMPCCHTHAVASRYGLERVDGLEREINHRRLMAVMACGYDGGLQEIDVRITPMNQFLCAWPMESERSPNGGLSPCVLPEALPPSLTGLRPGRGKGSRARENALEPADRTC